MYKYWWIYIAVALIIGLIGVLAYRNEKAYYEDYKLKQKEEIKKNSVAVQIAGDVDTIKSNIEQLAERVGNIEEKIDTIGLFRRHK